ncbi:hypothetical protein T01_11470 [Trichinella spiralis]|uniref:Uncharacterized protein n=1 Tax=Trichinella spiralis TaxID=6334 RepID=A0A0V1BEU2_TRISP|nr:hypothetical protein T01_11470 [Trichinella spiralis]
MIFTLLLDHDHVLFNLRAVNVMQMRDYLFYSSALPALIHNQNTLRKLAVGRTVGSPILMAPCHSCSTDAEMLNRAHYVEHPSSTILIKQTNAGYCCSKKTTPILTSYDQEIGRTFEVLILLDLGTGSCILVITVTKKNYTSISRHNRLADTLSHVTTEQQTLYLTSQPNSRYSISLHNRMTDTLFHATTERQIIRFTPQPNSRIPRKHKSSVIEQ